MAKAAANQEMISDIQSDPWTFHDPGFPVHIQVQPFADIDWNETRANMNGLLHIPSSVLTISVNLPKVINLTSSEVSITLFKLLSPLRKDNDRDLFGSDEVASTLHGKYHVLADSQVPYATSYNMNVGTEADNMTLRVYIEALIRSEPKSSQHTLRAYYVRPLSLLPSEPMYLECTGTTDHAKIDVRIASHPPVNMPMDLCNGYTMNGKVPIRQWYFDDQSDTDRTYEERSKEFIEELIQGATTKKRFYYGATDDYIYEALKIYPIKDKHVLIIGSTMPWYEAMCIANGAASCTTIDYNKLRYNHPLIQTFTLNEFEQRATRKQFDFIFSISSFEHDGLGRYGDPLDPEADIRAMESIRQYCHPKGSMDTTKVFIVVPVGADVVVWNAQRIYGPLRLPRLFQDWSIIKSFGFAQSDFTAPFTLAHQPLFVLEPKDTTRIKDKHTEL